MPLYEYKCAQCAAKFEKLVRMADADGEVTCPSCGSVQTKRLMSTFGWVGSGGSSASGSDGCAPSFGGG